MICIGNPLFTCICKWFSHKDFHLYQTFLPPCLQGILILYQKKLGERSLRSVQNHPIYVASRHLYPSPNLAQMLYWLVVYLPLWKMMEFVSWDDEIPNCFWKVIQNSLVPNHQPVYHFYPFFCGFFDQQPRMRMNSTGNSSGWILRIFTQKLVTVPMEVSIVMGVSQNGWFFSWKIHENTWKYHYNPL